MQVKYLTDLFIYENLNPLNKEVGDCVIRGIAKILDKDWYTTYDELCKHGRALVALPNSRDCYPNYLEGKGFKRIGLKPQKGKSRMTVFEFTKTHPKGRYLLKVQPHHVVAVIDGNYYDTWDCGKRFICSYYEKKEQV